MPERETNLGDGRGAAELLREVLMLAVEIESCEEMRPCDGRLRGEEVELEKLVDSETFFVLDGQTRVEQNRSGSDFVTDDFENVIQELSRRLPCSK